jgi:hypothetical protein
MTTTRTERIAQSVVILVGLLRAISSRNLPVNSDGLAYLDVARVYLRHDLSLAVNGYWGPLYSWLLAAMLWIVRPTAHHEFAVVRAVNFLILLLCLYAFSRFWRSVAYRNRKPDNDGVPLADAYPLGWLLLGYALFLTQVNWFIDAATPDVLVGGMVLLIAARVLELDDGKRQHLADYVGFGLLLAVGFYSKAILFYFGLFVLLAQMIRSFRSRQYRGPITAALVCILLVSPYAAALSRTLGHFTVGETGRLNYAWFVDGTETGPWVDGGASFPFFPGPVVLNVPKVFRIPNLEGVTYAPWYDAARFDKRSRATFNLRGELRQLSINSKALKEEILPMYSALLVPMIILICGAPKAFLRRFRALWFCATPIMMVIGMYLLVHLVDRFMIGFLLVLWGLAYSSISVPSNSRLLVRYALLSGVAVFGACALPGLLHTLASPSQDLIQRDVLVAEAMPNYGVRPGDSIGLIGDGQTAYWAHWAQVSVVAEVTSFDSDSFWSSSVELQRTALRSMAESGAKAVIWRRDSQRLCPPDWVQLPKDSGCMISLNQWYGHPS